MTSRFSRILPRLFLALALLVAPLPPVPAARATTGVLDQIQIYGHGIFQTMSDAVRSLASEAARRMNLTPPALGILHIGNVGSQGIVPEILKMIVAQDGIATLTGQAPPGSTIVVQSAGRTVGTARAGANGGWRLQLNYRLNEGDHTIQSLVRGPNGDSLVPGPGIRIAVPEDFSGSSVVYQTPTLRPQRRSQRFQDRSLGVRVGQAPAAAPNGPRGAFDDGASSTDDDDVPVAVNWLYRWLDTSSAAYQDIVIPDLSGADDASFPLALPDFDAPARRRFATGDVATDEARRRLQDGWLQPGATDWFWDGAGLAESRLRDWFADARRLFGRDVVRELSTGQPVSPADSGFDSRETADLDIDPDAARRAEETTDDAVADQAFPWPLADGRPAPSTDSEDRQADAETTPAENQDSTDSFPWPFADQPTPVPPEPADDIDVARDETDEAPATFPWPLATEDSKPAATEPDVLSAEELEKRRQQEDAIRKAQQDAEKARELAKQAAEQARKLRQETERLLAEEERLAKEAETARAEREKDRERQAKADAERFAEQKAEAAAAEEESKRQAERLRRRAEELAAAATAAADEEFARGNFADPKADRKVAADDGTGVTPEWPVVREGRRPPAGRRLSLKDSPADLVEEGSSEGDDAEEVYIPEVEELEPVKERAVKPRKSYRRAASKRRALHRARHLKKRKRSARKASSRRHRHAYKSRLAKKHRKARKRASHRRRLYKPRVRGLRYRRSSRRDCVSRSLRVMRRSLHRHLGRLVRGHRRVRRHGLYVGRARWRRR